MTSRHTMALGAALWFAFGLAPSASHAAEPKTVTYTVQPGDSVWGIAETFYGDGRKYPLVYRYNKFDGKPPHLLAVGRQLRLPIGDVGPEAIVRWIQRDVQAKPPRSIDWLPARPDMNLWRLYQVSTGDASAARIGFEDTSELRLREEALLVIYGASARRTKTTKRGKTRVVLKRGTLRSQLAALDGEVTPLTVETPAANVVLSGESAQLQADDDTARLSVYEGVARMFNPFGTVTVPKDHGTTAKKGRAPRPPRPLPPAPRWATDAPMALIVVPSGQRGHFEASWQGSSAATRYRVELARDPKFAETFVDVEVDATVTRLATPALDPGEFWARVSALDADRLESRPTPALSVRVARVTASRALTRADDGVYEAVGLARLTLPADVAASARVAVGDAPFRQAAEPVRLGTPGLHRLRYRLGDGPESRLDVRVLPARGAFVALPEALAVDAPGFEVAVTVTDPSGRPALLPGLALTTSPGGVVPLIADGPGRHVAEVASAPDHSHLALRLAWAGGVLAEETVTVDQPPAPPLARYRYRWANHATAPWWDRAGQATPLPSVLPIDHLGVRVAYLDHALDGGSSRVLALGIAGELSLMDDRLGLDAGATLLRPEIDSDSARRSEVGDLRLGVRYRILSVPFELAPFLRVRVPLGGDTVEQTDLAFEPGLLARVPLVDDLLWLDMRHALVTALDLGDDTALTYAGTWALGLRPVDLIGVTAFFDTSVPISAPPGEPADVALAAGGGVSFHLGRVRLGVSVGAGLNDAGRRALGQLSLGLSLDVGYGGP